MASNKFKNKARSITVSSIRKGELAKLPCQKCGNKKSESHHLDYFQPFKILWLCKEHHDEWHKKNKVKSYKIPKKAKIKTYLQMVRYELIESLLDKGYTEKDIGIIMNISKNTIRGVLDELG